MKNNLRIYVIPCSGREFVSQLALLGEVHDAFKVLRCKFKGSKDYAPDIALGCSGGNIAGYIALSADWSYCGIIQSTRCIDRQMFISSWVPLLPSWCMLPLTGSIYRQGYGVHPYFKTMFTPSSVQRVEIWTCTFNTKHSKAQFFCNRSCENAILQEKGHEKLYCSLPFSYLNGNIKEISDVTTASASVPFLVQSHDVRDIPYQDGAILYSSPLIPMSDSIRQALEDKHLHLFYFCSYDMDDVFGNNIIKMSQPFQAMIHSTILRDRNASVDLLRSLCCDELIYLQKRNICTEELAEIIEDCECHNHFVIIIYPIKTCIIEMDGFSHCDIVNAMNYIKNNNYGVHVWMTSD